jgi:hypothetical protein
MSTIAAMATVTTTAPIAAIRTQVRTTNESQEIKGKKKKTDISETNTETKNHNRN